MVDNSFDVRVSYCGENRLHVLRCRGIYVPLRRGNRKGHPDDWTPDEGGFAEDLVVDLVQGSRSRRLSKGCVERLVLFGGLDGDLLDALVTEGKVET